MPKKLRLWKVTDENARACHGGSFDYSPYLPTLRKNGTYKPGPWLPVIENPRVCRSGYHACRDQDLVHWLNGRIWAIEGCGVVEADDKVVMSSFRFVSPTPWDDVSARLFAVDVAAAVLPIFEKVSPNDSRVADCLEVARRFALGDATDTERAAAWAAAGAAAGDAARAAAWAAAGDAARAAAGAAAWAAARAAAWAAAGAAAWAAAGDAARAAAGAAAWAAAGDAARLAQTKRILWWIGASKDYE